MNFISTIYSLIKDESNRKVISWSIKIFVFALSYYFIYIQIFEKREIQSISQQLILLLTKGDASLFWIALILMLVNASLESLKWKFLIKKIEAITFLRSLNAIFSGRTLNIFAPYQLGEFGARVFHLDKADRWKAVIIVMIGNASQFVVTAILGIFGLFYFINIKMDLNNITYFLWIILGLVACGVILLAYFKMNWISNFFNMNKNFMRVEKYLQVFRYYSQIELTTVLLISSTRYIVFIAQYLLLLYAFNIQIPLLSVVMSIFIIYILHTIIPTITIAQLGIKGSLAIYFLGMFSTNHLGLLTATACLWLINQILPALIGSIFVFNMKFFRNNAP
ncbi:MAG: flippase-like domain-containing protein [Bacteroidia bacterium]|nr:flippase-like domain-containing protein [Bacteroidia bacterium]